MIAHYQESNGEGQPHRQEPPFHIRCASPADRKLLRRMIFRASSETIHRRFHLPYQDVPGWMLDLMLGHDHQDRQALVAVVEGEIVGHAMYVRLENDSEAEMAIVVEDDRQSMGVGKALLSELAQAARLRGIEAFIAEVFPENRRMLGLAAKFGGPSYTIEGGVYRVRMPLRTPEPTLSTTRALPAAA